MGGMTFKLYPDRVNLYIGKIRINKPELNHMNEDGIGNYA